MGSLPNRRISMGRNIAVLPSERSSDEAIQRIKESLKGLGKIAEGIGEEPDLIIIHDPDGIPDDAISLAESYPDARILFVTDSGNGMQLRRKCADVCGGKVSVVDCGNGGLRYEAELVLDIMDDPEKYRSYL